MGDVCVRGVFWVTCVFEECGGSRVCLGVCGVCVCSV